MTANGSPRISLTVPAKPDYVIVCRLALDGLAEAAPLSPETIADLKLAVTEACANSISHAFDDGDQGTINVCVSLAEEAITIEVVDNGVGMEQPEIADFSPEDELRESGMGLALIRALVDELEIGAGHEGLGTRVVFRKRLD
jgi:serine/threonine-protein kinase RsbW